MKSEHTVSPHLPQMHVVYSNDPRSVRRWIRNHSHIDALGFDTETVPSVRRSDPERGPSTIQLASADGACLVAHLEHFPEEESQLVDVLQNPLVIKVGEGMISQCCAMRQGWG